MTESTLRTTTGNMCARQRKRRQELTGVPKRREYRNQQPQQQQIAAHNK